MDDEWLDIQIFLLLHTNWCEADQTGVELPFEIKASDFLRAAQRHLAEGTDHVHLVDALTNAKRALDCRMQELLFVFGLDGRASARDWSIPQKLGVLAYLGLPAPKILRKLNRFRNAAEHDFRPLSADATADFLDAVALFLESTWWYIRNFADEAKFRGTECEWMYWRVSLDRELNQLTLRGYRVEDDGEEGATTIGVEHRLYLPLLRVYVAALFDRLLALQWTPPLPGGI